MFDKFTEQVIEMVGRNRQSRSASLPEPRSWYMDNNGVIVSKPLVKEKENPYQMSLGRSGKVCFYYRYQQD